MDTSAFQHFLSVALNIALVLGILGYFGIQTTSFAVLLAGAGVAVGAAWNGLLGNFTAGAFMLVLRSFKVGDFVQIDGVTAVARLRTAVAAIPNVATSPAPEVSLLDLKLEGPQIAVRPYADNDHHWQVCFDTNEAIVRVCRDAGWPTPALTQIHQVHQLLP